MERYISEDEIMHRIKTQPDLTKYDKYDFEIDLQILYLSDKGREKLRKPTMTNQQRNKLKYGKN